MSSESPNRLPIIPALIILGGVVSLVLAPQVSYLAALAKSVPLVATLGLNLLYGLGLGLACLRLIGFLMRRWDRELARRRALGLALVHLPLYLLWWPAALGASSSSFRIFTPLALTLSAAGLAGVGLVRRAPTGFRPGTLAGLTVFVVAFIGSMMMASHPFDGEVCFVSAALWGLYLLISLIGWGIVVNRVLLPAENLDWGQRAAWGLALAIAVGGVLNLVWGISPGSVLAFLAVGAGFWCASIDWRELSSGLTPGRLRRLADQPVTVVLVLITVGLAVFQYSTAVGGTVDTLVERPAFDLHDDCQAYLVFPKKMLQLGSLGPEPFEARRMLSLGGQSFLQTLVLVAQPLRTLHLLDGGVALLVVVGLVLGWARRQQWDRRHGMAVVLLVLLAFPYSGMRGNTSAMVTGIALMLSWFRLLGDGVLYRHPCLRNAGLVALTASGLCALKSTFIPAAVVIFAVSYLLYLVRTSSPSGQVLREAALAAVLIGLLVFPWMISIFESSHTLLYPVFGTGFYGGSYTNDFEEVTGDFDLSRLEYLQALRHHLFRMLPGFLLLIFVRDSKPRSPVSALVLAALLTVAALLLLGDPSLYRSLTRYAFPVYVSATMGLMLTAFEAGHCREEASRSTSVTAGLVVAVLLLAQSFAASDRVHGQKLREVIEALAGQPVVGEAERRGMAVMTALVPPEQALLSTVRYPFLFDFRQHQVLTMSLPGMASLPPGLPLFQNGEAVAEYLGQHSIRYLAYGGLDDLKDLLNLSEASIRAAYPKSKTRWAMLRCHSQYQRAVQELTRSRRRLYFDGAMVLLDLEQSVCTAVPGGYH